MPTINVITGPTVLVEYAGLRFLTDPTFDAPQDYDMGITVLKKTAGTPITPESVLPIDAVLLSHDTHPDNLDTSGRALLPKVGHVITTEDGEKNLQAEGLT
ncbi:MAG: MBL fold metallo-hydrolase, partial [Rothia mucilaginosa]